MEERSAEVRTRRKRERSAEPQIGKNEWFAEVRTGKSGKVSHGSGQGK
jgi:hypothetical protein